MSPLVYTFVGAGICIGNMIRVSWSEGEGWAVSGRGWGMSSPWWDFGGIWRGVQPVHRVGWCVFVGGSIVHLGQVGQRAKNSPVWVGQGRKSAALGWSEWLGFSSLGAALWIRADVRLDPVWVSPKYLVHLLRRTKLGQSICNVCMYPVYLNS